MHELSLCASITDIVRDHAAGRPVRRVRVRVGHLRQVVPDTLAHCWDLVVDGTDLDGTALEVEEVPLATRLRRLRHPHRPGPAGDAVRVLWRPAGRGGGGGRVPGDVPRRGGGLRWAGSTGTPTARRTTTTGMTTTTNDHGSDGADHGEQHRDVGDHSGYGTGALRVEVLEHILGENDRTAAANRRDFDAAGVAVVNLMSSPGRGKDHRAGAHAGTAGRTAAHRSGGG